MKKLTAMAAGALFLTGCADIEGLRDLTEIRDTVETVRYAVGDVPENEEREIGEALAEQLLGAAPPVQDPEVQRYVNRVGTWVARQSDRPRLDWTFAVIDVDTVNAYAAPGGYVFVTRGLFLLMEDEAELAGVLGHEIAHVTERHHMRELQRAARWGLAFDLVEQATGDGLDDEALRALANAGARLYDSGLSREDELDADRIGAIYAARAGYDPWALLSTLTTIEGIHPQALAVEQLTASHPPTEDRRNILAAHLDERLGDLNPGLRPIDRFREVRDRLAHDDT